MNILDTYFTIMGGAPPPRPVYTPPRPPKPAPAPVDNAMSAREKTADSKKRGRTSLITNKGGATGLGDDASGQKKTLGGY